ncbi:hypothetical protein [Algoriphagus antarcticus]|nr:hypothetical protein [Algoriphagus antarcticus]
MKNITFETIFKKDSLLFLIKVYVPTMLFLAVFFIVGRMNGIKFDYFSRDAIQTLWHEPGAVVEPYIGMLSNIGVIFWCFTVAILFFSSKIAKDFGKPKIVYQFFLFTGLLTLLMMIDDLFLLHDVIIPYYLNISEKLFYLFYGSSVVALLYTFRKVILNTDYILFLLAFGLMAGSVITDVLLAFGVNIRETYLIEDGFKFMGIISWFVYFVRTCYFNIRPVR